MAGASFDIYTVYQDTLDYPGRIVVRIFQITPRGERVAPEPLAVVMTLDEARSAIRRAYPGAVRMHRMPGDDPVIVETWI